MLIRSINATPLCYVNEKKQYIDIGTVQTIEKNHKAIEEAVVGDDVCICIISTDQQYSYGRHFSKKLYSKI